MGIRTAPILLLSRPDVQADLKLEETKVTSVQKLIEELTQRGQALRGQTGATAVAGRKAIDDAQREWLTTNLSEEQLTRLTQIDLQWEGPSAARQSSGRRRAFETHPKPTSQPEPTDRRA